MIWKRFVHLMRLNPKARIRRVVCTMAWSMSPGNWGLTLLLVRRHLRNLNRSFVEAGGSDLAHLLRVNVYLTDESQFPLLNKIYAEYIPEPYPPRTARVVELGPYAVEVDATAAVIDKE